MTAAPSILTPRFGLLGDVRMSGVNRNRAAWWTLVVRRGGRGSRDKPLHVGDARRGCSASCCTAQLGKSYPKMGPPRTTCVQPARGTGDSIHHAAHDFGGFSAGACAACRDPLPSSTSGSDGRVLRLQFCCLLSHLLVPVQRSAWQLRLAAGSSRRATTTSIRTAGAAAGTRSTAGQARS